MRPDVEAELDGVLSWTRSVRSGMEEFPDRRDELQMQGHAYVGGVLTTLDHLGLITDAEYTHWQDRLNEVLGDPPGGWIAG
ncbi:MAG TPA: hypothetical protein VGW10_01625 [Solirubrobacteraceae bacterium]|nr:hypothetical protein [Solirubrobacteraceae bacterium]